MGWVCVKAAILHCVALWQLALPCDADIQGREPNLDPPKAFTTAGVLSHLDFSGFNVSAKSLASRNIGTAT